MKLVVRLPVDGRDILAHLEATLPEIVPEVQLEGFPHLSFELASQIFREVLRVLTPGGSFEFTFTDFFPVVERYLVLNGVDAPLSDSLCGEHPSAIWDSRSVARVLLLLGFHAVWTGQVSGMTAPLTLAKGVKFNGETIAEAQTDHVPSERGVPCN